MNSSKQNTMCFPILRSFLIWKPAKTIPSFPWKTSGQISLSHTTQRAIKWPASQCINIQNRGAQYQYFIINSISIILVSFLSIPISISIILKRAYQYQYLINFSKSSFINFNINLLYQCPTMILIRLPISYQLVIVLNINIDIN